MSRATSFSPLRGNPVTEPFRVYLDRLIADDMHFNSYSDHRETRPFDEIVIYFGWLACGSRLIAPHLTECGMRQFDYTQTILRHPVVSAPPALTRRQMDVMFDDYESHLVREDARSIIVVNDWSYVDRYIRWFFRVSQMYMVQAAPRDPPRSAHQEILEEEQAQLHHAKDIFPRCSRIVEIAQEGIGRSIFPDGSDVGRV
ncbi:uncharacterized protein LOC127104333 [Lathyrus oleraceus]|uniref:uncharacterized protein LOC127104333 n=1 Tax=Pisum sativum TaxID=3888 RepID=UPI0021CF7E4E|nr:uncharacterized protein LOC127104333 [Pisum sativum]